MSKITKLSQVQGPWTVNKEAHNIIVDSSHLEVAMIVCDSDEEKIRTLSHLIAAAPELLMALYRALGLIKKWHGVEGWNHYYQQNPEMKPMRYIIAKANGEQPL